MPQRTWTLRRHPDGSGAVVVVTGRIEQLEELATVLADAGYFAFAAIPDGLLALSTVAAFDLVVVLGRVADEERAVVRRCQPAERLVELATDDRESLLATVRERLPRA